MTQNIKPNDFVYIPSRTKKVCRVKSNKDGLIVDDEEIINHINAQGYLYDFSIAKWVEQPFAFLATPKMKEKLEQVYGELEDIPVDEVVELFKEMLDTALYETEKGNFNKEKHFDELVQLFKERGAK